MSDAEKLKRLRNAVCELMEIDDPDDVDHFHDMIEIIQRNAPPDIRDATVGVLIALIDTV